MTGKLATQYKSNVLFAKTARVELTLVDVLNCHISVSIVACTSGGKGFETTTQYGKAIAAENETCLGTDWSNRADASLLQSRITKNSSQSQSRVVYLGQGELRSRNAVVKTSRGNALLVTP